MYLPQSCITIFYSGHIYIACCWPVTNHTIHTIQNTAILYENKLHKSFKPQSGRHSSHLTSDYFVHQLGQAELHSLVFLSLSVSNQNGLQEILVWYLEGGSEPFRSSDTFMGWLISLVRVSMRLANARPAHICLQLLIFQSQFCVQLHDKGTNFFQRAPRSVSLEAIRTAYFCSWVPACPCSISISILLSSN